MVSYDDRPLMVEVDAPVRNPRKLIWPYIAHEDPQRVAICELEADTKSASLVILDFSVSRPTEVSFVVYKLPSLYTQGPNYPTF